MSKLKKQIERIELEIAANNATIKHHQHLLKNHIEPMPYLYAGILGCFVYGYFLGRKKNIAQLTSTFIVMPIKFGRVCKKIKNILPFLL